MAPKESCATMPLSTFAAYVELHEAAKELRRLTREHNDRLADYSQLLRDGKMTEHKRQQWAQDTLRHLHEVHVAEVRVDRAITGVEVLEPIAAPEKALAATA